jgi:hypothetical protein
MYLSFQQSFTAPWHWENIEEKNRKGSGFPVFVDRTALNRDTDYYLGYSEVTNRRLGEFEGFACMYLIRCVVFSMKISCFLEYSPTFFKKIKNAVLNLEKIKNDLLMHLQRESFL